MQPFVSDRGNKENVIIPDCSVVAAATEDEQHLSAMQKAKLLNCILKGSCHNEKNELLATPRSPRVSSPIFVVKHDESCASLSRTIIGNPFMVREGKECALKEGVELAVTQFNSSQWDSFLNSRSKENLPSE